MSATSNSTTSGIAFVVGLLLGCVLIAPVIPEAVASLPSMSALSVVGKVLLAGTLGVLLLIVGIIGLYLTFMVVDR